MYYKYGELSEWSNVSLSKSDEVKASGGSNPPLSAKGNIMLKQQGDNMGKKIEPKEKQEMSFEEMNNLAMDFIKNNDVKTSAKIKRSKKKC